jgi:hypothetical protein
MHMHVLSSLGVRESIQDDGWGGCEVDEAIAGSG